VVEGVGASKILYLLSKRYHIKMPLASMIYNVIIGKSKPQIALLDFLKKDLSLNTVLNAARWTKEAGIKSIGYFMIGLPKETEKSVKTTLEFIRRCDFDFIKVNFFTPYPGSEIAKSIYKFGSFESNWTKMNEGYPVFIPLGIGIEKLYYYSKKYITSFYLRKKIFIRMIKRINNFRKKTIFNK